MQDDQTITRRATLSLMASALGLLALTTRSFADDGESGGDSSDSDSGNSGSGSDDSGSDSDNSDDDSDESGDDNSNNSGSGKNDTQDGRDQDNARDAVKNGKAIPLSKAMTIVKKRYGGRVISVKFMQHGTNLDYRFKVITSSGSVKNITMDATSGRIRGFFGL